MSKNKRKKYFSTCFWAKQVEKIFFHLFSARRTCTLLHKLSASGLVRLAEKYFFHLFPAGFEAKSIFLPFFPHFPAIFSVFSIDFLKSNFSSKVWLFIILGVTNKLPKLLFHCFWTGLSSYWFSQLHCSKAPKKIGLRPIF